MGSMSSLLRRTHPANHPMMTNILRRIPAHLYIAFASAFFALSFSFTAFAADLPTPKFELPAGEAPSTLKQFVDQSGVQVFYIATSVRGVRTNAVSGELTAREALDRMLAGTELSAVQDEKTGALSVRRESPDPNAQRAALAQSSDRPTSPVANKEKPLVLGTFEVMGSKLLNMDIKRSKDDPQPYVIFDGAKIQQSGALDVEDFLKQRLTMDVVGQTSSQAGTLGKGMSQINLRGLGFAQTLILVDGRRVVGPVFQNVVYQPDVNYIPLGAIDRIEVLPTTSAGIYGGGATGGVINIVLRRDYSGAELKLTYDNSFKTDSPRRRVDLNAGFNLEGGKTNVLFSASYSDAAMLFLKDRQFYQNGVARILTNNPNFLTPTLGFLGATPNIRSATGINLVLKSGTHLNSPFTFVPYGYTGAASDGGAALVANAGRYNFTPPNSAYFVSGLNTDLLSGSKVGSASLTIRRQFSPILQGYVDLNASQNRQQDRYAPSVFLTIPASSPTNPFQQAIGVNVPILGADADSGAFSMNRRVAAGFILKLPAEWKLAGDYTWNWASLQTMALQGFQPSATAAATAGTIDVLKDAAVVNTDFSSFLWLASYYPAPFRSTSDDSTLRLAGPTGSLPGGPITVSALAEFRDEGFGSGYLVSNGNPVFYPERSQSIASGYVEIQAPLFSKRNRVSGIENLTLQLAARHDDYTLHGTNQALSATTALVKVMNKLNSTDPTLALRYQPVKDVFFRASYGTGFVPPTVNQLAPLVQTGVVPSTLDPQRGNASVVAGPTFQYISGGNPNLRPEKSQSTSAGFVLTPEFLSGLRLSMDYTRIRKSDNIATLSTQQIVSNEGLFPGRVTRAAPAAGDPYSVGPVTGIDASAVNISSASLEAYDFSLDYERKTESMGTLAFFAGATYTPHYQTQLLAGQPWVENSGIEGQFNTVLNPGITLKKKASFGLTWSLEQWTFGWTARYFDSYLVADPTLVTSATVIINQGNGGKVAAQTYHDVFARYKFDRMGHGFLRVFVSDLEVQAGIRNVFDKAPPFDAASSRYYSYFGDPRLMSWYLSAKKSF